MLTGGAGGEYPPGLIEAVRRARGISVLTGAGISAESGIPTFREAQTGLWARYNPEELATPGAFHRDPVLVWEWYLWRKSIIQAAVPNAGHYALAAMEAQSSNFNLVTQNIDGLHQRAGSRQAIELHGNLFRSRCVDEGTRHDASVDPDEIPPRCPHCGAYLRPDVVWFGESLPEQELAEAFQAARDAEVFFTIGTSALVQPAASLPLYAAQAGAQVIEINPAPTPITRAVTHSLRGSAGEVLPALCEAAWPGCIQQKGLLNKGVMDGS